MTYGKYTQAQETAMAKRKAECYARWRAKTIQKAIDWMTDPEVGGRVRADRYRYTEQKLSKKMYQEILATIRTMEKETA